MESPAPAIRRARDRDRVLDDLKDVDRRGAPAMVLAFIRAIEEQPTDRPFLTRFLEEDAEADRLQRSHTRTARIAIFGGAAALVVAILQLAFRGVAASAEDHDSWSVVFFGLETIAIAPAVLAVGLALFRDLHEKRLLARYNSEQLRVAKWRLFAEPALWQSGSEGALVARVVKDARADVVTTIPALRARAESEEPLAMPEVPPPSNFEAGTLPGLAAHYRNNRLEAQIEYFRRKGRAEEHASLANPHLPTYFFLASVACVAFHLLLEGFALFGSADHRLQFGSSIGLLLAALIPAVWAGIRTWRSATEVTRNAMRASAKRTALEGYRTELEQAGLPPGRMFQIFALCEGLFEQEQGEWLRLMLESEWFL